MRILHFNKRLLLLRQIVNEFCREAAYERFKIPHNAVILIILKIGTHPILGISLKWDVSLFYML
jgi:hypothetical protein